ncbi:MAG: hypothetical protein ACW99G_17870 [Candidatus Thorarchaeota archaeon]|jgi:hypothetical protein
MIKLSELNDDQKGHLAWRLDHKTCCGYITAGAVARGDHGDLDVVDIFKKYGDRNERSAKIQARKVQNYKTDPDLKKGTEVGLILVSRISSVMRSETSGLNMKASAKAHEVVLGFLQSLTDSLSMLADDEKV